MQKTTVFFKRSELNLLEKMTDCRGVGVHVTLVLLQLSMIF
jgi:hypothetical protein